MEADLEEIGVGSYPHLGLKAAQKMEPTHGRDAGKIVQGQIVLKVTVDEVDGAGDLGLCGMSGERRGGAGGVIARQ